MNRFNRMNADRQNKRILITGASGLVGRNLGRELALLGYPITLVSRSEKVNLDFPHTLVVGNLSLAPIVALQEESFDGVFHLMGEPVAQRWTEAVKSSILKSRVASLQNLKLSLKDPKVLLSASAIGYYGDHQDSILDESAVPKDASDFLSSVCIQWENEALEIKKAFPACRTVISRTGIVLDAAEGALAKMLPFFKMGLGGKIGDGKAWMSWIHIQDLVKLMIFALENPKVEGVVNAVSPAPAQNFYFTEVLAANLRRPSFLPVPQLALQALYGEMSQILLASQRVIPKRLTELGFQFDFETLSGALADLLCASIKGERQLVFHQFLPGDLEKTFEFFANEKNLEKITPDSLHFQVLGKSTSEIQNQTQIDYRLKIHGIPTNWTSRIEEWSPPYQFVDLQIKGPYAKWHHTHQFFQVQGGVIMKDTVIYKEPLGLFGRLSAGALIELDIINIFAYRKKILKKIFNV